MMGTSHTSNYGKFVKIYNRSQAMIAYIQQNRFGDTFSESTKIAEQGFEALGVDVQKFKQLSEIANLNREDIVVGGVISVNQAFNRHNVVPDSLEYPKQLRNIKFLGRDIWTSTIGGIVEENNIFIKPLDGLKAFTGFVKSESSNLTLIKHLDENTEIWCSSIINISSEYRCFIRHGKILDIRWYKGDESKIPSQYFIFEMIKTFTKSPKAYTLDVGITDDDRNILIEVNDAYSISSYGISPVVYANFYTLAGQKS